MREDVIRMAQKAGLHLATDVNWMPIINLEYAEKFAAIVAAHTLANIDPSKFMSYQEAIEAGRLAEREACVRRAEVAMLGADRELTLRLITAIRARGTP